MAPRDFPVKWGEDELDCDDEVLQQHLIQAELDDLTEDEDEDEQSDQVSDSREQYNSEMQQLFIILEQQTAELLQLLLNRFNP
ncbi:uncharacterized protein DMAD_02000 [Drosophila madeirensis]|uniref:Uncharacterized protein n=1 Tax=Drosophila madeirensis TaxID=30013 RepID=A0AAU9G351_DROMD